MPETCVWRTLLEHGILTSYLGELSPKQPDEYAQSLIDLPVRVARGQRNSVSRKVKIRIVVEEPFEKAGDRRVVRQGAWNVFNRIILCIMRANFLLVFLIPPRQCIIFGFLLATRTLH